MSGKSNKIIVIFSVAGWVLLFLGFVLLWQRFQAYKKADSVFDRKNSLNQRKEHSDSVKYQNVTTSRRNVIVKAVEKIAPAVVSINVVQVKTEKQPIASDDIKEILGEFYLTQREYRKRVYSLGSGIILCPEGYILTNQHVIADAEEIRVTLANGKEYKGKITGEDVISDLAIIKIEPQEKLPFAKLGNSDDVVIGEWVVALGNPFGYILDDPNPTVTVGVVSAISKHFESEIKENHFYGKLIQTDAHINPGNSGGPLVNAEGEVIGVNTFIFGKNLATQKFGFAIPINRAKLIAFELMEYGKVRKTWVGIRGEELTSSLAKDLGLKKKQGFLVAGIEKDSPADRAGIKRGDVIISAQGEDIKNLMEWEEIAYLIRPGEKLNLKYFRNGKIYPVSFTTELLLPSSAQFGRER